MNDLLSNELRNDDLKMVNRSWKQMSVAMDMEPEMAFFDRFFYNRHWAKSIFMKNALARVHIGSASAKRAKELHKVEGIGHRHSGRSATGSSHISKNERSCKRQQFQSFPSSKGDAVKGYHMHWTSKGSRPTGATWPLKHDDPKQRKGKRAINDRDRRPPNRRQPLPTHEVSNRTGTSPSVLTIGLPCHSYGKESCPQDERCDCWHPTFCVFHKRGPHRAGAKCYVVHLSNDDRAPSPEQT